MSQAQPQNQPELSLLTDYHREWIEKCKSTPQRYDQPWYDKTCWDSGANSLNQLNYIENLNDLLPESCENYGPLVEPGPTTYVDAQVRPVFRDIESALIDEIAKHDCVVGCVAWLTSEPILTALQGKAVQFVVQQEDWLRPDSDQWSMQRQRALYDKLRGVNNYVAGASVCAYFDISPIRLCGKPKTLKRNNARMHHKFMLFGKAVHEKDKRQPNVYKFDLAWTGSYNITANATRSLENGLFIKSFDVVDAYYREWRQVLLSSVRVQDIWWDAKYAWTHEDEDLRDGT
jgi:hypothetical protein